MATIIQTGYVLSSPTGISCGLRGKKVYLAINSLGRICEYQRPVMATFIPTLCELRKRLKVARCWYQLLHVYPTQAAVVTIETTGIIVASEEHLDETALSSTEDIWHLPVENVGKLVEEAAKPNKKE